MPKGLFSKDYSASSLFGHDPARIALFALTGLGNTTLTALKEANFAPEFVVTRAEQGPFPYYDEEPFPVLAQRLGVPCLIDAEGEALLQRQTVDVLLIATYHRILPPSLLERARWRINLHPSLLPQYRGPNPFYWMIRNGEARAGVSAHLVTSAIDGGDIVWSESLSITAYETQGSLRRKLAITAARGAVVVIRDLREGKLTMTPQDESLASNFPRVTQFDRVLRPEFAMAEADRILRACTPFPGALADGFVVVAPSGNAGERIVRVPCADGEIAASIATCASLT
jgi:methionyl-tRNA formyltransferase